MLADALYETFQKDPVMWIVLFALIIISNVMKTKTRKRRR